MAIMDTDDFEELSAKNLNKVTGIVAKVNIFSINILTPKNTDRNKRAAALTPNLHIEHISSRIDIIYTILFIIHNTISTVIYCTK